MTRLDYDPAPTPSCEVRHFPLSPLPNEDGLHLPQVFPSKEPMSPGLYDPVAALIGLSDTSLP